MFVILGSVCNFIMECSRFKYYKNEIRKLTFRRFESKYHESLWGDYEKVLMVRSFMLATSRNLLWIVTAFLGVERYDRYDQWVEKKGGPPNREAADFFFSYAKVLLYALYFAGFFINIFGIKWPKLLKGYFYV